jgi:hypothetical protein
VVFQGAREVREKVYAAPLRSTMFRPGFYFVVLLVGIAGSYIFLLLNQTSKMFFLGGRAERANDGKQVQKSWGNFEA